MPRSLTLAIVASLLTAGCAIPPLRIAQAERAPMPATTREATTIFVQPGLLSAGASLAAAKCSPEAATSDEAGGFALLAPLIGIAVDTLFNAVSARLAAEKAARTGSWTAQIGGVPLEAGHHYCLALSRGILTTQGSGAGDAVVLGGDVAFQGVPAFVLLADLAVAPAKDGATVTVTPQFLSYAETSAPRRGSGKKDIAVILTFDGSVPAAAKPGEDAPASSGVRLAFGRLAIGQSYDARLLANMKATTSVSLDKQVTVSSMVTESEDPSVALTAFSAAFDQNKDALASALKQTIEDALSNDAATAPQ